jgi:hypothetical protein
MLLTVVQLQDMLFSDFFIELCYIQVNNCIIIIGIIIMINFRILYFEMVPLQNHQLV